jgi:hypothetical protein
VVWAAGCVEIIQKSPFHPLPVPVLRTHVTITRGGAQRATMLTPQLWFALLVGLYVHLTVLPSILRRLFGASESDESLESLGLFPTALLFVQEREDEEL